MTTFLTTPQDRRIACNHTTGSGPGVVFLGGFKSDMTGSKAMFLQDWARATGRSFLRFDYSGHGASGGAFEDGAISDWRQDAEAVIDALTEGPQILVGSSMGGWISLLLARDRPDRVAGLVGIAAAPDFTRWGLSLTAEDVEQLSHRGFTTRPSAYAAEPYRYSRTLIEDADGACLLDAPIPLGCPVRLLHGLEDQDVPWSVSMRLASALRSADVQVTLVKGGDHRLSAPPDLALLFQTIEGLAP